MTEFSANLGFLWTDRPLPDAIYAAAKAGFRAVECHWPFDVASGEIKAALNATGLKMLGLNTRRGDIAAGENGLSALPGHEAEATVSIDEAIQYAIDIEAHNIHVMAGNSKGDAAKNVFVKNLQYACDQAVNNQLTILIEPLNRFDAPGYFLENTSQAVEIINEVQRPNLKLMFDCYHVGRTEIDVSSHLTELMPIVGHIQFASVPDRGPPDRGDVDYKSIFAQIAQLKWNSPLGAEYKPDGDTDASLEWVNSLT